MPRQPVDVLALLHPIFDGIHQYAAQTAILAEITTQLTRDIALFCNATPSPPQTLAWLRSQPFTAAGLQIPVACLEPLPPLARGGS